MKKTTRLLAFAVALLLPLPLGAAAQESGEVLRNADIITLTEVGLPTGIIVSKIQTTRTDFDMSVQGLVALSKAGVEEAVLEAMTQAASGGVRAEAPRRAGGAPGAGRTATGADAQAASVASRQPGETFRDPRSSGGVGPEMVVIPAGSFEMGCVSGVGCYDDEQPVHQVTIPQALAVGKYEVTFEEYDRFTMPTGRVADSGWGRGRRPVINVSWQDAKDYVRWLSQETGESYRLLSESEWEYTARAGTVTAYSWGNKIDSGRANCDGCGGQWDSQTAPVGSFSANGFGLHDMHGNVSEWVEDCWNGSYNRAPSNGGAWEQCDCSLRVLRGGSWYGSPGSLRSALRLRGGPTGIRIDIIGFRVARTLTP